MLYLVDVFVLCETATYRITVIHILNEQHIHRNSLGNLYQILSSLCTVAIVTIISV